MPSSKANIQTTNPPPNLKPNISSITKLHKPQKEAKNKPRKQHHKRSFQENSLGLSKLLDWIKWQNVLWNRNSIIINPRISFNSWIPSISNTTVGSNIEKTTNLTSTTGTVVQDWVLRTTSHFLFQNSMVGIGFRNGLFEMGYFQWDLQSFLFGVFVTKIWGKGLGLKGEGVRKRMSLGLWFFS